MPEYMISGIPVIFPFEPYKVQTDYMRKVIECIEEGKNGLLESPTGTGKTLSLLCSSLAWLRHKKEMLLQEGKIKAEESSENELEESFEMHENSEREKDLPPRIIYSSRTHSQLAQAMKELKRSAYSQMRASVIGSRDQMCIHPKVTEEKNHATKNQLCKKKIKAKSCSFYKNVDKMKNSPAFNEVPIMDVEELVVAGRKTTCCPYFMSKELQKKADIVFMPYNYLLDPKARKANKSELQNAIVILDEAHNVEKMCEESASVQIKSSEIIIAIADINFMIEEFAMGGYLDESREFTVEDLESIRELLINLERAVENIPMIVNGDEGTTYPGGYIFDLLQQANITEENYQGILTHLESIIENSALPGRSVTIKGTGLQTLCDVLLIVFADQLADHKERVSRCYKVHCELEDIKSKENDTQSDVWVPNVNKSKKNIKTKIVSYWCFSAGFGMQSLLGNNVRCIILTSGTLAPLKPLISELTIPITVNLENPHIIGKSQIFVKIVSQGPDKEPLNSNFKNRDNPKYTASLGRTILSFSSVVPGGMLIFFPSYPILGRCEDSWRASGLWTQIEKNKPVFIEPRNKDEFTTCMTDFYEKINDPSMKGAIFMAVCRGKVSEGLDFADVNGRAVLITGIPFPPLKDPKVILKKKYLQENRNSKNGLLSGDDWYILEASRAVNQAIGRVIRHKDDYGAILLCDTRFNNPRHRNQLSKWIQGHLSTSSLNYGSIGPIIGELSKFFKNAERTLPKPGERKTIKDEVISSEFFNESFTESSNNLDVLRAKIRALEGETSIKSEVRSTENLVTIHKRERVSTITNTGIDTRIKKSKFAVNSNIIEIIDDSEDEQVFVEPKLEPTVFKIVPSDRRDILTMIKSNISDNSYKEFLMALNVYNENNDFDLLFNFFEDVFGRCQNMKFIFTGLIRFIKEEHEKQFQEKLDNWII